jgi:peptidoglycan/LPS O-acetylase OafA/YrhL
MRDTSPAGTATNAGAYRPDIDGMRALAVGLVVLHHVGFHRVSGGYIGVDVFFVISGYLITSIIFPKIAERRFSYLDFFGRRVKRLSPVLSLVIAVTLAAGLVLLLPSDLEKLASSAVWVSLFAGNFFFWRNYGGYFADDAQSAPLLHTWSLAVEEQYYLLWPLSLVIALRLFGARNTVILICLAVPPLIYLSELGTRLTIGAAYYLLPTRFSSYWWDPWRHCCTCPSAWRCIATSPRCSAARVSPRLSMRASRSRRRAPSRATTPCGPCSAPCW